jgi:hypothetical protein
LVYREY